MKKTVIYCMTLFLYTVCSATESSEQTILDENKELSVVEEKQVAFWERKLADSRQKPPTERPEILWLGLRNMAHWISNGTGSASVEETYRRIQQELLSIPGHARYFAKELERIRTKDQTIGKMNHLQKLHLYVGETLVHLPSPETVGVLGQMLEDTRDAPPPDNPFRDMGGSTRNPHLAAITLSKLGIRNYPLGRHFQPGFDDFEPWLEWWKEVKAGKRTFSFEGQDMEYRFNADGTWETIPLLQTAVNSPPAAKDAVSGRPDKKARPAPSKKEPPPGSSWVWIIVTAMAVLGAWIWVSWKNRKPAS